VLIVAGDGGRVAGVEAFAESGVEFGRIAAERRLRQGGVDDGDGYLGALWDIDGAGEADNAVFVDAVVEFHMKTPVMAVHSLFHILKNLL